MTGSEKRKRIAEIKEEIINSQTLDVLLELSKELTSLTESLLQTPKKTLVDTFKRAKYTIELFTWITNQDQQVWNLIFKDAETNVLNEELSDTVYLSEKAALNEISKYKETKQKITPKKEEIKETIQKVNMTATYAKMLITGNKVDVVFTNETEQNTITFKYRKSWSMRKHLDKALTESGIQPSWDFKYGWEYLDRKEAI